MWAALGNYRDFALLVLRVGIGLSLIALHGWPKLAGGLAKWKAVGGAMTHFGIAVAPAFWGFMAALSESLGCALIILGLFFRPSCVFVLCTMIVASVVDFKSGGFPKASHAMELATVFFALIFLGPGKYGIDKN